MPTASASTQALVDALLAATPHAEWRTTYTADQVGIDFVNRYGFIELYGPEGHYVSEQSRAFIGYWGNQLYYPPHSHEAEELYYIVAGEALFAVDDDAVQSSALQNSALRNPALRNPALRNRDSQLRSPEDSQTHSTCQPHSMTTQDSAVLCLVLWRGAGLAGSARLND